MSWTIVHIYAILPWDIHRPCEGFPGPSFNVLDYSCIISILLQDMYDSCDQFPRPPYECPGLLLIRGQNNVRSTLYRPYLIRFKGVQFSLHHPTTNYSNNILLFYCFGHFQLYNSCKIVLAKAVLWPQCMTIFLNNL
jgi:hypothetical protein